MADETNAPQQPEHAAPARVPEQPQQRLPVDASHFGKGGRITRQGMLHAIRNGGTVIFNRTEGEDDKFRIRAHRHIARVEDIPTDADLAETPDQKAAARQRIEDERRRLDEQLASLGDPEPAPGNKKK